MFVLLIALQTVVVHNVHVVPMDREQVLPDQVVVISNGRIAQVGPRATTPIPQSATMIDGRGGYLLPGLTDFHVHLRLREDASAYLAFGVTTVVDMGGPEYVRRWRDDIRKGKVIGPQMYLGRFIDGRGHPGGVKNESAARDVVQRAARQSYDFIKVYNALSEKQFNAIIKEAKKRRLPVLGHGVRSVGLEKAFAAGQAAVVHAEEYLYTDLQRSLDTTNIARVVAFTKQSGAWVIPNLSAFSMIARQWARPEVLELVLESPEAERLPAFWLKEWRNSDYVKRSGTLEPQNEFLRRLTLALHRAGVPLLAGTDSPIIPGMFPGLSLHDDLRLLVAAGLTPFEALRTATANAGQFAATFFPRPDRFGLIAPGYRADLVLVEDNPFSDISVLRQPVAVMTAGKWLDREMLDALLERWARAATN